MMLKAKGGMDRLDQVLEALFQDCVVIRTEASFEHADVAARITIELRGSLALMSSPESFMDPRIVKILKAAQSAAEMREDNG